MSDLTAINFEEITLRQEISTRGGGIEIDLSTLGYEEELMTAYQNYLGGGMLGRVCSDCTICNWQNDPKLNAIAEQLRQYFHALTNPDEDEWESVSYLKNQHMPDSAF